MEVLLEPRLWAEHHFGTADLGDRRRTRRLVAAAAAIAAHPEKPFPHLFDWNALRGFYRLCDRPDATLAAVQGPHWEHTRQAMSRHRVVLILHDTTELDFTAHPSLQGAGPIGDGKGRGFLQHNSLAVVPAPRQVLGLAYQQWSVRRPAPDGDSGYRRKRRPCASDVWPEGIRAAGAVPPGCCWVDVCDRAGDDYEAMRAARQLGHDFLLRVQHNRVVWVTPACDRPAHLMDYARTLPSLGSDQVEIPGRGGRAPRTATVSLAAAPVWVPAPKGTPQRQAQPVLAAWVLRIWEAQPPRGVEKPLEWILVCSLPTDRLEELKERRDWYCCRWLVEVYHDIEKNGCSEEDRRFETADRLASCVAVLAVVAVRVFQLRCALDHQPEASAEQVATEVERQVVRQLVGQRGRRFTVRDFVRGVARLGGFLGRTRDGDPGVRALWRGYQRLQDMIAGFQLHASSTDAPPAEG
jgi:hypothetical protein